MKDFIPSMLMIWSNQRQEFSQFKKKYKNPTERFSFIASSGYFTGLKNCLTFLHVNLSWQAASKTSPPYKNKMKYLNWWNILSVLMELTSIRSKCLRGGSMNPWVYSCKVWSDSRCKSGDVLEFWLIIVRAALTKLICKWSVPILLYPSAMFA